MPLLDATSLTGDATNAKQSTREQSFMHKNASSSDYKLAGFLGYSGTAESDSIQLGSSGHFSEDSGYTDRRAALTSQRYTLNSAVKRAASLSDLLCNAAVSENAIDTAQYKDQLKAQLRKLWRMKSLREEHWQKILNYLLISLSGLENKEISAEQCSVLARVVRYGIASGSVGNQDVVDTVTALKKSRLNPFALVSID